MKKGTKLYSVITGTCPRCQGHKMFKYGPYKVTKMREMHKSCPSCGQSFMPEPNFFEGSMYVSYAFSVALVVSVFTAFNVLYEDPSVDAMVLWGVLLAVLFAPMNLRLSRMIWANFFIHYEKPANH